MSEIRRAQLLEDCNDRLCKATGGKIDTYGGSFERSLKHLEGLRALKCVKRGKKLTVVVPDIKRVEDLLINYKIKGSIDDIHGTILQRKIEDDLWERTVERETNLAFDEKTIGKLGVYLPIKDKTKQTETHLLLKEITGKITSHVLSRLLEFYTASR